MNYELKSVSPGSVFFNAIRIFLVVGFIVAVISFFIIHNPNLLIAGFMQKVMATVLFTAVYGFVVAIVLTLIAWLYNIWAARFKGITIHFEQQ